MAPVLIFPRFSSFRFGRKKPIISSFLLSGLSCIAIAVIPSRSDDGQRNCELQLFLLQMHLSNDLYANRV